MIDHDVASGVASDVTSLGDLVRLLSVASLGLFVGAQLTSFAELTYGRIGTGF